MTKTQRIIIAAVVAAIALVGVVLFVASRGDGPKRSDAECREINARAESLIAARATLPINDLDAYSSLLAQLSSVQSQLEDCK